MAVAAKRLLGKNKWPELLQFVYQYSQSEVEERRELAFIILNELAEALGKSFEGQFAQLKQVYQAALHDPRSRKVGGWLGSPTTTICVGALMKSTGLAHASINQPTDLDPPQKQKNRCKWRRSRRAQRC
jgi:hypothetical protein